MATESAIIGLKEDTIEKLRELRRLNVDSAKGFKECADLIADAALKSAFESIAQERSGQADSLGHHVEWNEGDEQERGSYAAAVHRAWIKVRDACTSDSTSTVLIEAERGEDVIKEAYEEALEETSGSPIHDTIAEQYACVKKTHDRVRGLRDKHNG